MTMIELAKNFALVLSVASVPIVLYFGLLEFARRDEERRAARTLPSPPPSE